MTAELVTLTRELYETFHGEPPAFRVRGVAVLEEGSPVVVGGLGFHQGFITVFMDMLPAATKYPKLLLRGGRLVVEMARQHSLPAFAVQDEKLESAPRFLARLGFEPDGELWRLQ